MAADPSPQRNSVPRSRDRVQIGLHHASHAADAGEARQVVRTAPVAATEVAQRFDRDVDADLVAVLEAVSDGLGGRVDANLDALDSVGVDSLGEGRVREARDPQTRVVEPRLALWWLAPSFCNDRRIQASRSRKSTLEEETRGWQRDPGALRDRSISWSFAHGARHPKKNFRARLGRTTC